MKLKWIGLFILFFVEIACVQSPKPNIINSQETDYDHSQVAGPPVTRTQAVLTAHTFARVHWTMTEVNQRGITCNNNFFSDYQEGARLGVGYKWGGWDTVEDFLQKIAEGYGTGTGAYVSYIEYPFECVTGVSCTGLVSRAWHLEEKYTLTYPDRPDVPNQFHEITHPIPGVDLGNRKTDNLKKGDAFMNATHIILFVYETRDGIPMVIDSRQDGVRFRREFWDILFAQGYYALRYNNIQEEQNPEGTRENPISIQSLPYTHEGNTCAVLSMEYDRYSVDMSVNQQGPEVIYQLRLDNSATVCIRTTDVKTEGINNDIFLLASLDVNNTRQSTDCIAGSDIEIEIALEKGVYYIVVDSGRDLPGEYTLSVSER